MNRVWMASVCVCVCVCTNPERVDAQTLRAHRVTPVEARDVRAPQQTAPLSAESVLEENIRIVIHIQRPDTDPVSIDVVTAHDVVSLNALAGFADIDGNAVPIALRFNALIEPRGEGEYVLNYELDMSRPLVTAVSSSTAGSKQSTFQYQKQGVEASVRLGIGRAVTILRDPNKEIRLELQSVTE